MRDSFENDEPLRKTLREWKVTDALPPRFLEQVWRQIARKEVRGKVSGRNWLMVIFNRPAIAVAYVVFLTAMGLTAGLWHAHAQTAHLDDTLGSRYIQLIDPYQRLR